MHSDPIVEGVRKARARLAARFGHDLTKIVEHIKRREHENGRQVVSRVRERPTRAPMR